MTDLEIKKRIEVLALQYPDIDNIEIEYNGAGDSFESMWTNTNGVDYEDYEDLCEEMIERADSDFNNEGSSGYIFIDLLEKTIEIKDYYNVVTQELNRTIKI